MIAKESRMKRQWICARMGVPLFAIRATHDGRTERRTVDVAAGAHAREVFVWRMAS